MEINTKLGSLPKSGLAHKSNNCRPNIANATKAGPLYLTKAGGLTITAKASL
jgi:hypothetical protein